MSVFRQVIYLIQIAQSRRRGKGHLLLCGKLQNLHGLSDDLSASRPPPPERAGLGRIRINGRPFDDYFKPMLSRMEVMKPFELTKTLGAFDVKANIHGGGVSGQAAVRANP